MSQAPKELTDWVAYVEDVRRTAHEQGRAEGFGQGYQKGLDDASAVAAAAVVGVAEMVKNKIVEIVHHETEQQQAQQRPRQRPRLTESAEITWTGEETNREKVLRALKAQPGMRPVEVIAWLENHGGEPNANSITTTIKRMRDIDIVKRGDGWYLHGMESAA